MNARLALTVVIASTAASGCSVGMALAGKEAPDITVVRLGAARDDVVMELGAPVRTEPTEIGGRIDTYKYEFGDEPSAGRAFMHGAMDLATLGLWELFGTPAELSQGADRHVVVEYGPDDTVIQVLATSSTDHTSK